MLIRDELTLSDWDIDDIFNELFRNMRRFMGDESLFRPPERYRSTSAAPKSEEIIQYEDAVLLVLELGPQYKEDNIDLELYEKEGRRILEIKSFVNNFVRRYGLSDEMTGEFTWSLTNGMLEVTFTKIKH